MTLRIVEGIDQVCEKVKNGTISGIRLASQGRDAVFAGIGTPEWETLMLNFAANSTKELDRLCGRDQAFRDTEWGELCLAYIAGDSICTSETAMKGGTRRTMSEVLERKMLELIDAEGADLKILNDAALSAKTSNALEAQTENSRNPDNTDSSDTDTSNDKD